VKIPCVGISFRNKFLNSSKNFKMKLFSAIYGFAAASPVSQIINGQDVGNIEDVPWQVSIRPRTMA
jgi:hypothetical protein